MTPELFTHLNGDYREQACTPPPETHFRWPIETDDQVEALARECAWDNRKYMTPADYAIWCERMRKFARLAALATTEGSDNAG